MQEYLKIAQKHLTTPITLAIFLVAAALLVLGERQDAFFVSVVVLVNISIGIIQEIRARIELRKLEVLSNPKIKLLAGNQIQEIEPEQLKVGDLIRIEAGDEVPVDGQILKSQQVEINESILTGEAVPVKKKIGEVVMATSIVVSGLADVKVQAIGQQTRAGKMEAKLKDYNPETTPIQAFITKAVRWLTMLAFALAVIILVVNGFQARPLVESVKTIASAAITIVPEGLLLASTLLMAYGSVRLVQAKVLPQRLSAIESMALLDVLCVDKTGTLTSPEIIFDKLHFFSKLSSTDEKLLRQLLWILSEESVTATSTSQAITKALPRVHSYKIIETLPFSSDRKLSGIKVRRLFKTYSIIMGAPEFVAKIAPIDEASQQLIDQLAADGLRTLLVAYTPADLPLDSPKLVGQPMGVISLRNDLRDGVTEAIEFMQTNGIKVKVISGDHPQTVSFIAKKAGIDDYEQLTTGAELDKIAADKTQNWDKFVLQHTIFARILPEQKEQIVAAFRRAGLHTGMVGDGINDALALKRSNLGISMKTSAPATRKTADIVLMNDAFTSLPAGMKLGYQIIQAIELVACLFFHKIIFSLTLSFLSILVMSRYPFGPRHVTFMNIFLVTLPTVLFTVFQPTPRHRIDPERFWQDTFKTMLPLGVSSGLAIFLSYQFMILFSPETSTGESTIAVLVATFFGMFMVFLTNLMFDTKATEYTKLASVTYIFASSLIMITSFSFKVTRLFFDFYRPEGFGLLLTLVTVGAAAYWQYRYARKIQLTKRQLSRSK